MNWELRRLQGVEGLDDGESCSLGNGRKLGDQYAIDVHLSVLPSQRKRTRDHTQCTLGHLGPQAGSALGCSVDPPVLWIRVGRLLVRIDHLGGLITTPWPTVRSLLEDRTRDSGQGRRGRVPGRPRLLAHGGVDHRVVR